ncbi:MAG: M42 family metallopeptidase [Pirellulaceae bacterium]
MEAAPLEFLKRLLETPSPSGYERPAQDVVRQYVADFADKVTTDLHGNVIAAKNPGGKLRVMFAGHCDQIGMVVTHINDNGFLYAQTIGGWDAQQLIGQRMVIWTSGGPIPAVISRKPIHLLTDEERKQVVKLEDLWLDIGAKTKAEAAELIRVGDPVTLKLGFQEMRNGLANAPQMDNKTGLWVCIEGLRRAAKKGLKCSVYAVSTVAEEIGLRGVQTAAFGIDPQVGIAVDVTHATDCPSIDKKQQGDIALGSGPVIFRGPNMNPVVTERLINLAKEHCLSYQLAANGRAVSNDANAMQINRAGVATGLVAIPNRYMHSAVEMVSLEDIDKAADLLAAFVTSLDGTEDFTP